MFQVRILGRALKQTQTVVAFAGHCHISHDPDFRETRRQNPSDDPLPTESWVTWWMFEPWKPCAWHTRQAHLLRTGCITAHFKDNLHQRGQDYDWVHQIPSPFRISPETQITAWILHMVTCSKHSLICLGSTKKNYSRWHHYIKLWCLGVCWLFPMS